MITGTKRKGNPEILLRCNGQIKVFLKNDCMLHVYVRTLEMCKSCLKICDYGFEP